jgi:sugar diacid utilization regulator
MVCMCGHGSFVLTLELMIKGIMACNYIAQNLLLHDHTLNYKPERFKFITRL